MVFVRNWPFFYFTILGLVGQENVFYDILKRKNTFTGYKKKVQKVKKVEIFPKGLDHGFGQIWQFFHFFILGLVGQKNVFYDILEQKHPFLG